MQKKNFNLRNVVAIAICLAGMTIFSGCDKDNDPPAISVADNNSLKQEVFADKEQGKSGVTFTTTGAWISSISTVSPSAQSVQMRAATNSPDWIWISPESGGAGTQTINIMLKTNTTGADRTAVITISCNGDKIKITVTQKGKTANNEIPQDPDSNAKLISKVSMAFFNSEGKSEEMNMVEFSYNNQGKIERLKETSNNQILTYEVSHLNNRVLFYCNARNNIEITLNNEGDAVAITTKQARDYIDDGNVTNFLETMAITYTNRQIKTLNRHYKWLDNPNIGGDEQESYEYAWTNDNLVSAVVGYGGTNEHYYSRNIRDIEYSNHTNNYNLDVNWFLYIDMVGNFAGTLGYYGKSSKNLVSKITTTYEEEDYGTDVWTYFYKFDSRENLIECEISVNRNGIYAGKAVLAFEYK
jgi:hypothetical protein